jgi:hypothetical protein
MSSVGLLIVFSSSKRGHIPLFGASFEDGSESRINVPDLAISYTGRKDGEQFQRKETTINGYKS